MTNEEIDWNAERRREAQTANPNPTGTPAMNKSYNAIIDPFAEYAL